MKKNVRNIRAGITLLLSVLLFTSCKSSKSEKSEQQYTGNSRQQNDAGTIREQELQTEREKIVHQVLSQQLDINQKEIEYDTAMPINILTGKPPVKKEKETSFEKKTDKNTQIAEQTKVNQQVSEATHDKSWFENQFVYTNSTESEANIQKESDIFLKWIGGLTLLLVILSLFLYILRKYIKKKLHGFL